MKGATTKRVLASGWVERGGEYSTSVRFPFGVLKTLDLDSSTGITLYVYYVLLDCILYNFTIGNLMFYVIFHSKNLDVI